MICPKCEKETQGPDFCGHCGASVTEKRSECEEIIELACERREEAERGYKTFKKTYPGINPLKFTQSFSMIMLTMLSTLSSNCYLLYLLISHFEPSVVSQEDTGVILACGFVSFLIMMFLIFFVCSRLDDLAEAYMKRKFISINPQYAQLKEFGGEQ